MNEELTLLGGIGLGVGLMYFFDPQTGERRRERLRNQITGTLNQINEGVDSTIRSVTHYGQGLEAEIRSWAASEGGANDRDEGGFFGREEVHNGLSQLGDQAASAMRLNLFEENWTPTTRFLAGTIGCALMGNCMAQRTLPAALLGTLGFGLFVRSWTNTTLRQLCGEVCEQSGLMRSGRSEDQMTRQNTTDGKSRPAL
jgi:hypothetical protein